MLYTKQDPNFDRSDTRRLHVTSETGRLRSVIIGTADNFNLAGAEIINETQKAYYFGDQRPTRRTLVRQIDRYAQTLTDLGVEVLRPRPIAGIPDQMMTRDIGVTIGNTLLITNMAARSRRNEWRGIGHVLDEISGRQILRVPDHLVIEGGDIVVDKGKIFVGISQRTTIDGVEFLARHFPQYEVIPVFLKGVEEGENILHLDCGFVPVGPHYALAYTAGIHRLPRAIRENYELIEVTRPEQDILATNVLNVSPEIVISRAQSIRVNDEMRGRGLDVIPLPYTDPPKTGGSFRCCSLPLYRD